MYYSYHFSLPCLKKNTKNSKGYQRKVHFHTYTFIKKYPIYTIIIVVSFDSYKLNVSYTFYTSRRAECNYNTV